MRLNRSRHPSKLNNLDMTQGRILPCVFAFALPLMASSILQQMYSLADAVLVRRLIGLNAFAAIGADGTILWLFESMLMGLSHGFGVVFAVRFGAKEEAELGDAYRCAMTLASAFGACFAMLVLCCAEIFLRVVSTPQELLESAKAYLLAMSLFVAAAALFNTSAAYLRAVGDSKTPLNAMFFSSIANIALDLLFMGAFKMGVFGAGLATALSQLSAYIVCRRKIRRTNRGFGVWRAQAGALLKMGVPSMLGDGVVALGGGIVQRLVNTFGVATVAGVASSKKYFTMLQLMGGGLEGSAATFAGQNTGACNGKRVKEGMRLFVLLGIAASCVTALIVVLCARPLIGFVVGYEDTQTLAMGMKALRCAALFLPSLYLLCILRAFLQNMGHANLAMGCGFTELLARAVAVVVLPPLIGETSAFVAEEIGWVLTLVYIVFCLYIVSFRSRKKE